MSDWLPDSGSGAGRSATRSAKDVGGTPGQDSMRRWARALLVTMTLLSAIGAAYYGMRPDLANAFAGIPLIALPLWIAFLVAVTLTVLQVSSRWRPGVVGLAWLTSAAAPFLLATGFFTFYASTVMDTAPARVVSHQPAPPNTPVPLRVDYGDRTGIAYWTDYTLRGDVQRYSPPPPGQSAQFFTDPLGLIPDQNAYAIPGWQVVLAVAALIIAVTALGAVCVSALTRRRSFISASGDDDNDAPTAAAGRAG